MWVTTMFCQTAWGRLLLARRRSIFFFLYVEWVFILPSFFFRPTAYKRINMLVLRLVKNVLFTIAYIIYFIYGAYMYVDYY